jgi:hypothetical protein
VLLALSWFNDRPGEIGSMGSEVSCSKSHRQGTSNIVTISKGKNIQALGNAVFLL